VVTRAGRLAGRLSAWTPAADEIAQTLRRVVDKLLHAPTVRSRAGLLSGGDEYAAALRVLSTSIPRRSRRHLRRAGAPE